MGNNEEVWSVGCRERLCADSVVHTPPEHGGSAVTHRGKERRDRELERTERRERAREN